jgi:hypothetical protein
MKLANKRPRRWFGFSLRTLFVVVTALACGLGWQLNVVRARHAALKQMAVTPGFHITTAAAWRARVAGTSPFPPAATIPRVRVWLGDEAIQEIWYTPPIQTPREFQLAELRKLFPEAEVREVLPEPCHPGCFPAGTRIDTPHGPRSIDSLQAGDVVTSLNRNGHVVSSVVHTVFATQNRLWKIETEAGTLTTTETQPLWRSLHETVRAGSLVPGDRVLCRSGERIETVAVRGVFRTNRVERVFNLILEDTEIFLAGGFLARSKPPAKQLDVRAFTLPPGASETSP